MALAYVKVRIEQTRSISGLPYFRDVTTNRQASVRFDTKICLFQNLYFLKELSAEISIAPMNDEIFPEQIQ